jgi:hypothetical protein
VRGRYEGCVVCWTKFVLRDGSVDRGTGHLIYGKTSRLGEAMSHTLAWEKTRWIWVRGAKIRSCSGEIGQAGCRLGMGSE